MVSKIIITIVIFYTGYCALLFFAQRKIMYPIGLMETVQHVTINSPETEKIWLQTDAGQVEAWLLKLEPDAHKYPYPITIFAHGNAELIDYLPQEFKMFTDAGIGVLLVEYPGYGRSEGSPSQKSITNTFLTAYDLLLEREDVDSNRIILYGRSMGGGAICQLAKRRPSAAVILSSTFVSARSFAKKYLAPGFLILDPFDNLSVITDYKGPVLIIHGRRDEIIPYAHGVSLSKAAGNGKFITYECGHNDCPPDLKRFQQDLMSFLNRNGIL